MSAINTNKRGRYWQYRFEVAAIDGKRKQFSKSGFRTKKDALEAGTKALNEYNNTGFTFRPSEMSVADVFKYWLKNSVAINLSDSTVRDYKNVINKYIIPAIGGYRIGHVSVLTLQEMINNIYVTHHFSKSHMRNIMIVTRRGFRYAKRSMRLIATSPADDVELPLMEPEADKPIKTYSRQEIEQMLMMVRDVPCQYYGLLVAYSTGMRRSEVYGLTWDRIDLDAGTITIDRIVKRQTKDFHTGQRAGGTRGKARTIWYLGAGQPQADRTPWEVWGQGCDHALLDIPHQALPFAGEDTWRGNA